VVVPIERIPRHGSIQTITAMEHFAKTGCQTILQFRDEIDPNEINTDLGNFGAFRLNRYEARCEVPDCTQADRRQPFSVAASAAVPTTTAFRGFRCNGVSWIPATSRRCKTRLNELGFGPLVVDGDFGEATENAVLHFQARKLITDGRPLAIDGEVGRQLGRPSSARHRI